MRIMFILEFLMWATRSIKILKNLCALNITTPFARALHLQFYLIFYRLYILKLFNIYIKKNLTYFKLQYQKIALLRNTICVIATTLSIKLLCMSPSNYFSSRHYRKSYSLISFRFSISFRESKVKPFNWDSVSTNKFIKSRVR